MTRSSGLLRSCSWAVDHLMRRIASRSNILPASTLCISSSRAVWCLYIDATCLNYDGNAFDAALIAIMAALGNSAYTCSLQTKPQLANVTLVMMLATLPQATFDPDTSRTTCSRTIRVPLSLNKNRMVVGLSFGCVGGRSLAVLCLQCSSLTYPSPPARPHFSRIPHPLKSPCSRLRSVSSLIWRDACSALNGGQWATTMVVREKY